MKLLREMIHDVQVLAEEKDGRKSYFIEGIWLQSNIKNRNGRIYPTHILEREVKRYNEQYISQNRALGELGHPDSPTINLDRVSHKIVRLEKDGDNWVGKAKIMETPNGKIAATLLGEGIKIGVSSRGLGSLKSTNEGINEVQDDFYLATAGDIVADPSAPDAFVQGIMENKEWVYMDGRGWVEQFIEQTKDKIQTMTAKQVHEQKAAFFEEFLIRASGIKTKE
jgi:hypothetical protein